MVLDLFPVDDKREVIAAVLEVVADIPAVKSRCPAKISLRRIRPSCSARRAINSSEKPADSALRAFSLICAGGIS